MTDRPRFFDDLAGVAGGAMSALAGLREEMEGTMRARAEEVIRKLDLVRREDLEAIAEMAANARAAQATAESAQAALERRVAALEARLAAVPTATAASTATAAAAASTSSPLTAPLPPASRPADEGAAEGSPS